MEQAQLDIAAVKEMLRQIDERSRLDSQSLQKLAQANGSPASVQARRSAAQTWLGALLLAAIAPAVAAAVRDSRHSGSVAVLIALLLLLLVVLRYFTADR
jgi:VIT1/CCC1 family predicted Fe2+/Mn2+ transporter